MLAQKVPLQVILPTIGTLSAVRTKSTCGVAIERLFTDMVKKFGALFLKTTDAISKSVSLKEEMLKAPFPRDSGGMVKFLATWTILGTRRVVSLLKTVDWMVTSSGAVVGVVDDDDVVANVQVATKMTTTARNRIESDKEGEDLLL